MSEEKQVKIQLLKTMLLNLITFSIIFYILGVVIYTQFNNSLYVSADMELTNASNKQIDMPKDRMEQPENKMGGKPINNGNSPRIVIIERDKNGQILEDDEKNDKLNNIFENTSFNKDIINSIYEIEIEGYSYRGINYKNMDGTYKQVLINVDSEKIISQKFIINLIISFITSLFVILIASYILSKEALKPIVQSWKRQNQFVQDASHELRTPLSVIKVKQEKLLENPESKIIDNAEDISIALEETQRLTKLIKELMELAKNDSEQLKLDKQQISFDKEMKSLIEMYKDVAQAEGKTLNIDLKFNEQINADSSKLKELIVILLDNAIKYTKEGDSIYIKTYKKDSKFVLEVEDTGIGISKEAIEHVFERFYREEKSRNRQKGGMGLGLSIAYNIVKLHKGTIKFDKNMEKGTKVIVKIPLK